MEPVSVTPITYSAKTHTFFDDLATMVFSLFSHSFTATTSQILNDAGRPGQQRPAEALLREIGRPLQYSEFGFSMPMNCCDEAFIVLMLWLQTPINIGSWPQFIEMYRVPTSALIPGKSYGYEQNKKVFQRRIVGSSFISYYASQESKIETKYGKEHKKWPDVVNFARIIRNGFAHGGKINFLNPTADPVSWRKWVYGTSDNGTEFFGNSDGLANGDIILLFEDLHQAIYT